MILVAMTSRSGSSMVCRVLAEHGLRWQCGRNNPRQQPRGGAAGYDTYEHTHLKMLMKRLAGGKWPLGQMVPVTNWRLDLMKTAEPFLAQIDFLKVGVEFIDLWRAYWECMHNGRTLYIVKVYRPAIDVAESIARRGIGDKLEGFNVALKRQALMDEIEGRTVCTPLLAKGQFKMSGMRDILHWVRVKPDLQACARAIQKEKFHA